MSGAKIFRLPKALTAIICFPLILISSPKAEAVLWLDPSFLSLFLDEITSSIYGLDSNPPPKPPVRPQPTLEDDMRSWSKRYGETMNGRYPRIQETLRLVGGELREKSGPNPCVRLLTHGSLFVVPIPSQLKYEFAGPLVESRDGYPAPRIEMLKSQKEVLEFVKAYHEMSENYCRFSTRFSSENAYKRAFERDLQSLMERLNSAKRSWDEASRRN